MGNCTVKVGFQRRQRASACQSRPPTDGGGNPVSVHFSGIPPATAVTAQLAEGTKSPTRRRGPPRARKAINVSKSSVISSTFCRPDAGRGSQLPPGKNCVEWSHETKLLPGRTACASWACSAARPATATACGRPTIEAGARTPRAPLGRAPVPSPAQRLLVQLCHDRADRRLTAGRRRLRVTCSGTDEGHPKRAQDRRPHGRPVEPLDHQVRRQKTYLKLPSTKEDPTSPTRSGSPVTVAEDNSATTATGAWAVIGDEHPLPRDPVTWARWCSFLVEDEHQGEARRRGGASRHRPGRRY